MELGAHQQAAAQARRELEAAAENKENCETELDAISDKLSRNEERVSLADGIELCRVVSCR
jgi:hypothetical protein